MREEATSYPCPLLLPKQGAVVEREARHHRCCSLAVAEGGVVFECVAIGFWVESLK
jgi:hypothetical protein